jgi:hypothetical protein
VSFKFFPDDWEATRARHAPGGTPAPGRLESPGKNPPAEGQRKTASAQSPLSLFLPELPAAKPGSRRLIANDAPQTPSTAPAADPAGVNASRADATTADDLRKQLRQTEIALEQSKGDTAALRLDLARLQHAGAQLAEEYTRISDACRQTRQRCTVAAEALDGIANRRGALDADLARNADERHASLNQLAREAINLAADFQAQKPSIEHGLAEAMRITGLLATFSARVAKLSENPLLEDAAGTAAPLERRTAAAAIDIDRRVVLAGQKHTIEQALAEAVRVTDAVSALDARIAALAGPGQLPEHAAETVGHLARTAAATPHLEEGANDKAAVEHGLLNIQKHLPTATESEQRDLVVPVAQPPRPEIPRAALVATSPTLSEPLASDATVVWSPATVEAAVDATILLRETTVDANVEATVAAINLRPETIVDASGVRSDATVVWSQAPVAATLEGTVTKAVTKNGEKTEKTAGKTVALIPSDATVILTPKTTPTAWRWAAGFGAVAALVLFGTFVMRSPAQPAGIAGAGQSARQESASALPASPLPSRTWPVAALAMPLETAARVTRIPTSATISVPGPTTTPAPSPAAAGVAASRSDVAAATRSPRAPAPSPSPESGENRGQQFSGTLDVESVPSGAAVFINQERVGQTPVLLKQIRAGSHVLWLEREGYERWSTSVLVPADKQTLVNAKLQAVRDR